MACDHCHRSDETYSFDSSLMSDYLIVQPPQVQKRFALGYNKPDSFLKVVSTFVQGSVALSAKMVSNLGS